jgi:hypothetical protein
VCYLITVITFFEKLQSSLNRLQTSMSANTSHEFFLRMMEAALIRRYPSYVKSSEATEGGEEALDPHGPGLFIPDEKICKIEDIPCFPQFGYSRSLRVKYYKLHWTRHVKDFPDFLLDIVFEYLEPDPVFVNDVFQTCLPATRVTHKVLSVQETSSPMSFVLEDDRLEKQTRFSFDVCYFKNQSFRLLNEFRSYSEDSKRLPGAILSFDSGDPHYFLLVIVGPYHSVYSGEFLWFEGTLTAEYPLECPRLKLLTSKQLKQ